MSGSKKNLFPILFVIFIDNFGYSILFNLLPSIFLDPNALLLPGGTSLAARNALLAITFGVFPLSQFFGAPLIGDFADHFGRKKAFYLTILGVTGGLVLSAMAISIHSFLLLLFSRLLTGLFAGNLSVCLAAIADLSPDENSRARSYSHVTTTFGFSWIFAMIFAGYFVSSQYVGEHGATIAFAITASLSLFSYLFIYLFFEESFEKTREVSFRIWGGIKNIIEAFWLKGARGFFLVYFLWVLGWGMTIQWFPAYSLERYSISNVSITSWMIVLGVTWTLGSSIINGWLLCWLHSITLALIGYIIAAGLIFLSLWVENFEIFGTLLSLAALVSAFAMCNTLNLISMSAPLEVQGKVMGLSQSAMSFGWITTSIVAVLLSQKDVWYLYWYTSIAMMMAFCLLLGLYFMRRAKSITEEPTEESINFIDHQEEE